MKITNSDSDLDTAVTGLDTSLFTVVVVVPDTMSIC